MSANVHYEVYVKKHRKAGWLLHQACEDRKEAIEIAIEARGESEECSVRVSKESFDEINDIFHSTQIFSKGPETHQRKLREDKKMDPPCSSPSDLYALHARRTLGRALGPWLKRNNITVIELLYRSDMAERLAAAGFDRQHAVQKVAIAQAGAQECSVQHVVRKLTDLADKATDRLRKLEKTGKLPGFHKKGYAATFAAAKKHSDTAFALHHALAKALSPMQEWDQKVAFLAGCVSDALVEGKGCADSIHMLDEFTSEIVALPHALNKMVGGDTLGDRLDRITDMLMGKPPESGSEGSRLLAKALTSKQLPMTQSALAARIFSELCGPRRLCPDNFEKEVALNRSIADRLVAVNRALAPIDQISEAFNIRSKRLLENDAIHSLLKRHSNSAAEEIKCLLRLEESIVGDQNKVKLASFLRAVIGSHKTRSWFVKKSKNSLNIIANIAQAQRSVLSSSFKQSDKDELSMQLDRLCADIIADTGIIRKLEYQNKDPIEAGRALMQLVEGGVLTLGTVSNNICKKTLQLLRTSQVREELRNNNPKTVKIAREINTMMQRIRANT